jgi:hypothetical protein
MTKKNKSKTKEKVIFSSDNHSHNDMNEQEQNLYQNALRNFFKLNPEIKVLLGDETYISHQEK